MPASDTKPGAPRRKKVAPLNVVPIRPAVNAECVAQLERLLERARAGRIHFIAYACEGPDKIITTGWHGSGTNQFVTSGAVAHLQYRIAKTIDESEDAGG